MADDCLTTKISEATGVLVRMTIAHNKHFSCAKAVPMRIKTSYLHCPTSLEDNLAYISEALDFARGRRLD
eukprot:2673074-Pleurochrysis_carterae.AAC.5